MNEEAQNVEVVEEVEVTAEPTQTQPQDEKKYTDADVDNIIAKKYAKWKAEVEQAESEAKKISKMDSVQKAQYEAEKARKEAEDLRAELTRKGLETEASKILSEKGLTVSQALLDIVVKSDAESTLEAINGFEALVSKLAEDKVKQLLVGKTPTKFDGGAKTISKDEFNRMTVSERNKLFVENRALYDELTKN